MPYSTAMLKPWSRLPIYEVWYEASPNKRRAGRKFTILYPPFSAFLVSWRTSVDHVRQRYGSAFDCILRLLNSVRSPKSCS